MRKNFLFYDVLCKTSLKPHLPKYNNFKKTLQYPFTQTISIEIFLTICSFVTSSLKKFQLILEDYKFFWWFGICVSTEVGDNTL